MTAAKWTREECADGSAFWYEFRVSPGLSYSIDISFPYFSAQFFAWGYDAPIGPLRKTLRAAHNDCKRHARRLRAELVKFDRAKLP